jgi:hypothetical protein
VVLGASVALASLSLFPSGARAADPPRVAYLGTEYLGSEIAGDHGGAQGLLDTAAAAGVTSTAVTPVALLPAEVPRDADGHLCTGPSCMASVAQASQATYFVRVDVRQDGAAKEKFFVKVQVLRANPFQVVVSDESTCDDCGLVASLTNHVRYQVAGAMAKLIHEAAKPPAAAGSDATAAGSGLGGDGTEAPPRSSSTLGRVVPLAVGGAGAVAVGIGAYFWFRGDQSTCPGVSSSECGRTFDSKPKGALIAGIGAVAIAGAAVLWWKWPSGGEAPSSTMVGLTPGGLTVRGRF